MSVSMDAGGVRREPPKLRLRHVAAAVIGNALSFYDFLTYSFFAVQIGHTFFPSHDPTTSLLSSLAVFGAGFLTRPLGGVVIGRMGDRIGRRPAMLISFALLGAAIVGLALTPSYASIGVAAPILVIVFRLLQGFALGGEVGPTTAFLLEAAPPSQRGFYTSLQYTTQDVAVLCAGLVGVVLAQVFDAKGLDDYGWRIAFLIGALIVPFGLIIRRDLPETLHHALDPLGGAEADTHAGVRPFLRVAILGLMLLASGTIVSYVLNYMTTYANTTLHLAAGIAFWATVVNGLCGLCFDSVGGWLSDRVGRKPVMIAGWSMLLAAALPCFYMIDHFPTPWALLLATAILSTMAAIGAPPVLVAITEALPARIRSGALATIYALAISVFGGSTQFVVAWMIKLTGNPLAPAWYLTGAIAIGLTAMAFMKETAPVKTGR